MRSLERGSDGLYIYICEQFNRCRWWARGEVLCEWIGRAAGERSPADDDGSSDSVALSCRQS